MSEPAAGLRGFIHEEAKRGKLFIELDELLGKAKDAKLLLTEHKKEADAVDKQMLAARKELETLSTQKEKFIQEARGELDMQIHRSEKAQAAAEDALKTAETKSADLDKERARVKQLEVDLEKRVFDDLDAQIQERNDKIAALDKTIAASDNTLKARLAGVLEMEARRVTAEEALQKLQKILEN